MITLPNFDIMSIESPEHGLQLVHDNLNVMRSIANDTDFNDKEKRDNFCKNIGFLKQYYERIEVLIRERLRNGN
jgi:hypothetical protein